MALLPVICFPFAGAGVAAFRRAQEFPGSRSRICPVQLPGRAQRFAEPLLSDIHPAADLLAGEIVDLLAGEVECALFGHSLGAVLAFEVARRLERDTELSVRGVFVSGAPGPWTRRARRATGLSQAEFLNRVEELAGHRDPALHDEDLREMLLPILQADVELHEAYLAEPGASVRAPVFAVRGIDDELVSAADAEQWRAATRSDFRLIELPGDHMYLVEDPLAVVRILEDHLPSLVDR